jgi:signal transduction histidine kinase
VEAVVQTLAALGCNGENLAEVAHDARNMVTALGLYCDLLDEPGVLAVPFAHYSNELRLVAAASRRLVEKLVALDAQTATGQETGGSEISNFDAPHSDSSHSDSPGSSRPGLDSPGFDSPGLDSWTAGGLPDLTLRRALNTSLERSIDRSNDRSNDRSIDRTIDQTMDLSPDGTPDRSADRSADRSIDRRMNSSPDRAAQRSAGRDPGQPDAEGALEPGLGRSRRWESIFAEPIQNLAADLVANRNLLAALAGPGIAVTVDTEGGARPVRLTAEDLTRLLVNLVKNAAEAMPAGGRIRISLRETSLPEASLPEASLPEIGLRERPASSGAAESLLLTIEDNGPGIAPGALEKIFESGFTTHSRSGQRRPGASGAGDTGSAASGAGWPSAHRGLGLAITRSIVEASGGCIAAANREGADLTGARFEIELPVRGV